MASGADFLRKEASPLHAARVGRNHDQIGQVELAEMAHKNGAGEEMIHGDIEEALDLRRMQVTEQSAIGACGGKQIGNELGADGDARAILAVLAGVPVVGHHHRDSGRRGALECVNHYQ